MRDKLQQFCNRFFTPISAIFVVLITGLAAAPDFLPLRYPFTILVYFGLLLISGAYVYISYLNQDEVAKAKEIKSELDQHIQQIDEIAENIFVLFDGLLLNLAEKLEVISDSQSRVSIYVHHQDNGHFIPCGRYSNAPKLKAKGRSSYSDEQGCIGKAWENGWHFDNSFSNQRKRHQKKCLEEYNIPETDHDKIKMLSRLYAVKRIDGTNKKPLAVIVFESKDKDKEKLKEEKIREKLEDAVRDYSQTILAFQKQILDANTTKGEGI